MKSSYPRYGGGCRERLEPLLDEKERAILERYVQYLSATSGEGYQKRSQLCLLQFRDVIEKPLYSVTGDDAVMFWGLLRKSSYEMHTKIVVMKVVKRFLKWHYVDLKMLEPLKIPDNYRFNKKKLNKPALLTQGERKRMLHAAEKLSEKALLTLFVPLGARPQEIRNLRWIDVNLSAGYVHFHSNKTGDDRVLPMLDAFEHLRRWKAEWVYPDPQDADYVFPSRTGERYLREKSISVSYMCRTIKRLAKLAGIKKNVWTYLLRHTALTSIHEIGVRGLEHNYFAGHSDDSKQTQVYVHLDPKDHIRNINDKYYKVHQLSPKGKKQYDQRIRDLEKQNETSEKLQQNQKSEITLLNQKVAALHKVIEQLQIR